jgi:uncharacterized protein YaaR (DUF327 family)
VLNGVFCL